MNLLVLALPDFSVLVATAFLRYWYRTISCDNLLGSDRMKIPKLSSTNALHPVKTSKAYCSYFRTYLPLLVATIFFSAF